MKSLKIALLSVCAAAALTASALADAIPVPTPAPSPDTGGASWLPYLLIVAAVAAIGVVIAVVRGKTKGGSR